MEIDAARRMALTRAHSGEHILFKSVQSVLEKRKQSITVKKVDLDVRESSLFVLCPALSWDVLLEAEQLANRIIKEDRIVIEHLVTKDDFIKEQHSKYKDIRIKLERIKDATIRVVEVKDFDYSACAGTHVRSTQEIKNVFITKFSASGAGEFEIRFSVGTDDALVFAGFSRTAASIAQINPEQLPEAIRRFMTEQEAAKEKLRSLQRQQPLELAQTPVMSTMRAPLNLKYGTFCVEDKKILIEKVSDMLQENDVAVIENACGEGSLQTHHLYLFSKSPAYDAGAIFRKLQGTLPIKGGGGKDFAAGATATSFDKVIEAIVALLSSW